MTKPKKDEQKIEDEPGAEDRFKGILKRALHTPPSRKQASAVKTKPKSKPR